MWDLKIQFKVFNNQQGTYNFKLLSSITSDNLYSNESLSFQITTRSESQMFYFKNLCHQRSLPLLFPPKAETRFLN